MMHEKKFIRKTTKLERRNQKAPDMAEIRNNTPNLVERPQKYFDLALEKLETPEPVKALSIKIFNFLKSKNSQFSGWGDPMPIIGGILYHSYVHLGFKQNLRERIANALGINKQMITNGSKYVRNNYSNKS